MKVPRLHIITDTTVQDRYSHEELAKMAFAAGNVAVQYRNKTYDPIRDRDELERIAALARRRGLPLIINDDAGLAFRVGAMGVHLGREDGPVGAARERLGLRALIGATVHERTELEALRGQPLDYIGVGPVYGTHSKETGLPDLGLEGLAEICALSPWPVIAIGGIGSGQVEEILKAGAYGCAVISAFCKSENPGDSARQMLDILERA